MARPLSLSIPRIGLEAVIEEYTNAMVAASDDKVDPVNFDTVAWWSGGSAPGVDATNTVYMYGHSWNKPAVFNDLKDLQVGDEIFVTTEKGVLRYAVEFSYQVPKTGLTANDDYKDAEAGRLTLVSCYRETGNEETTKDNLVVQAQLQPPQS